MIREEEIREAADKTFPCTNGGRCYEQSIGASGFELGVEWADKHPKSLWISVDDDLPCNHEELISAKDNSTKKVIVVDKYDGVIVDFMRNVNKLWYWRHAVHALYWMPIPELPKE